MGLGTVARMAFSKPVQQALGKFFIGSELMAKPGALAMRLAPDVAFGALAAATTPGDYADKLIAGTTQAVGGGLTGLMMGRGARALGAGNELQGLVDMGGSILGDMGGMVVGDTLQRGKDKLFGGEGLTAYERMSKDQQDAFAQQIQAQTLAGLGYVPGMQDQYLASLGLG